MKKLYLLDAYALIYRAYYALIRSPRNFQHPARCEIAKKVAQSLRAVFPTHGAQQ